MDMNQVSQDEQRTESGSGGGRLFIAIVVLGVLLALGYFWFGQGTPSTTSSIGTESVEQKEIDGVSGDVVSNTSASDVSTNPVTEGSSTSTMPTYTLADVAKHATPESCWLASAGGVYDVTTFIDKHPGGEKILQGCGKDMTQFFATKHAKQSRDQLPAFKIGVLK
jgi:cytochrome b involved in lipid metabolism